MIANTPIASSPLASGTGAPPAAPYSASAPTRFVCFGPYTASAPTSVSVVTDILYFSKAHTSFRCFRFYTTSAPASVSVVGNTYAPYAAVRFTCREVYTPSAPSAVYVLGAGAKGAYRPSAKSRFTVYTDAVPYFASAPTEVSVNDYTRYSRVYSRKAHTRLNVFGHYGTSAKTRFFVIDGAIQQGSLLTTAQPTFWGLRVVVAGLDVTPRLVGQASIHCSENAATVSEFTVLPFGGLVDLTRYVGQPVAMDFRSAPTHDWFRRFTGLVDTVDYDPDTTLTRFTCTDGLQLIFERIAGESARLLGDANVKLIAAENERNRRLHSIYMQSATMSQQMADTLTLQADELVAKAQSDVYDAESRTGTEVQAIVGGLWSWMIFTSQGGWDAFNDCMSTQLASYNLDSYGQGVLADWEAKDPADFSFTADDYIDASLKVGQVASARSIVNAVDIKFEYRFTRLFEYTFPLNWETDLMYTACAIFGAPQSWGLCDHARVAQALTGAGLCVKTQKGLNGHTLAIGASGGSSGLSFTPVPAPQYVMLPNTSVMALDSWAGYGADSPRFSAISGFSCQALKRYKQTVSETVIHSITYPQSIQQTGRMQRTVTHAIESKLHTTALAQQIVDGWEEVVNDSFSYPVSKDGVCNGVAAGGLATSIVQNVTLGLDRYKFTYPSYPPDNNVKPSIGRLQNWDDTKSSIDGRDERNNAFATVCAVAVKTIAASHRQGEVSFDILAHETIELYHTAEVTRDDPAFHAKGKVKALSHTYDITSGSATTTVTLALMKSWSTGAHYVDPYVPLPDTGTIVYPGTLFKSTLTTWPPYDYNLLGQGKPGELDENPPASLRFRGYNFFTSQMIIESPPIPQEAQAAFKTVTRTSETISLPDDTFVVAA